jgi:hypothetical protein
MPNAFEPTTFTSLKYHGDHSNRPAACTPVTDTTPRAAITRNASSNVFGAPIVS